MAFVVFDKKRDHNRWSWGLLRHRHPLNLDIAITSWLVKFLIIRFAVMKRKMIIASSNKLECSVLTRCYLNIRNLYYRYITTCRDDIQIYHKIYSYQSTPRNRSVPVKYNLHARLAKNVLFWLHSIASLFILLWVMYFKLRSNLIPGMETVKINCI